ncbi:MAG: TonB-dependent receptor [Pseudomonadota bacterium]
MRNLLLGGVALTSLTVFSIAPAVAQTVDDVEEIDDRRDTIVVTARKKEENIQDVPVAVSAFSQDDLFNQGIKDIEDLSRRTPGFVFDTPFGRQFDRPIIRGQANILGDSGVSVFIDNVNVTQSIRSLNFGDIDRIEIIKGPQSALFGRNTYSGAINITTRQPTNEISADVSLEAGQYGLMQFLGNLRGPLIDDKLFFSISGRIYEFDSEFDVDGNENPSIGNESSRSVSGVVRAYPTENWEITLRAAYNTDDDGHFPVGLLGFEDLNINVPGGTDVGGGQPFFQGVVPTSFPTPSGSSQLSDTLGEGGGIEREEEFYALNTNYDFDNGYSLFGTIGYTRETFRDELDSDGQLTSFATARIFGPFPLGPPGSPIGVGLTPFDFTTTDDDERETFVAEARIDSPADKAFRWRLGGYFFRNVRRDRDLLGRFADGTREAQALASFNQANAEIAAALGQFFVVPLAEFEYGPANPENTTNRNIAVYGSVAYDLTDRLTATAELRWQEETIKQEAFVQATNEVILLDGVNAEVEESFTAVTPRFILDYRATDNNLIFASAARGTKPGGFNGEQGFEFGFGTFDEERLWQFEVGSKNTFADGQILLNGSFYFSTLQGYQLTENLAALGANTTVGSVTANVGDVEIFGLEVDTVITPDALRGLTVGANYAWTDTEFTDGTEATQGAVFGDSSIVGQELPRQARHQAAFFADYSLNPGGEIDPVLSVNGNYLSSRFAQVQNLAESGDAFELDARITFNFREKYSLAFYGRNLTDEDAALGVLRFIDPSPGNGSFQVNGVTPSTVFQLAADGQSRGFQFNNRNGRRWGIVVRAQF